ncbi:MAG: hypothetical protein A2007_02300 [Verrucomicrobia bacterium GWC2_42_7]|nr:MAG: hypothetical protein A2007_02300 [Verrucomicrobia bacterium GWC2_42_7]
MFQYQVKLQWIVGRANSQGWELHLRYCSQKGFTGPCYLTGFEGTARFDDTETGMNVFTREKDKEGKILCFDFEVGSEIESICVYKYSASTPTTEVDDLGLESGFFDEPVASSSSSSAPH